MKILLQFPDLLERRFVQLSRNCLRKKEAGMVFGNILGSMVTNSTLILGVTALIKPIDLMMIKNSSLVAILVYIISFFLLWIFIKTKLLLQRWEGLLLTGVYLLFILGELLLFG